ncbi:CPBP family intramembrane glutamic endopeptidase [Candidatus Thiosymbion oneisti]|uniref:CPBP family intramembrane glutamic endopeptidase n=1 Tax=Candidatus Thiosymbion oneisti TaxID=589554 RepID=UPI000A978452|nr:CPBP family intramembrane glutamic endopeptidase [Candidatus Thiosymbion oneisti]
MRETGIFFLYLFGCLILGALLTYPLMQTGWIAYDPHRVMGRLAQVFILIGLWPFLKAMHLNDRTALGYGISRARFLSALGRGWLLGVAILLVLVLNLLLLEIRVPHGAGVDWLPALLRKSIQALIGGLLTSLLEETFFRGALYSAIRRRGGVGSAILWSSFLFTLVHFMKPHALPEGTAFDWLGTGQMFGQVFADAFQWRHLDSMAALFLAGVLLALVREHSGHIGWCMGLHAGWIFVIQVTRHLTDGNQASPNAWLAGNYDGIIGWLAAGWIGLLALGFWSFTRNQERERRA